MKLAIAAALVTTSASLAVASPCGSDSGSSSDSSSSSSDSSSDSSWSDSSSSSDTSSPAKPSCVDVTDVHGYRRCKKYGAWGKTTAMPGIILELGTAMRQFASPLADETGSVSHDGQQFSFRVVGTPPEAPSAPLDTALVLATRAGFAFEHGFYTVLELEVGRVVDSHATPAMETQGPANIRDTGVSLFGGNVVGGYRTRLGNLSLGVEAVAGLRVLSYHYESQYLACVTTTSITTSMEVLEGRARAALWVSPFVQLGAQAGKSLVDDSWMGGIFLGGNTRAFGGHAF